MIHRTQRLLLTTKPPSERTPKRPESRKEQFPDPTPL